MELYLTRHTDIESGEEFFKVGVSGSASSRFDYGTNKVLDSDLPLREKAERSFAGQRYLPDHPYKVEIIHKVDFKFDGEALVHEDQLLKQLKSFQYWPIKYFSGKTECFKSDQSTLDLIIQYMNQTADEAKASEPSELRYRLAQTQINEKGPIKRHKATIEHLERNR